MLQLGYYCANIFILCRFLIVHIMIWGPRTGYHVQIKIYIAKACKNVDLMNNAKNFVKIMLFSSFTRR